MACSFGRARLGWAVNFINSYKHFEVLANNYSTLFITTLFLLVYIGIQWRMTYIGQFPILKKNKQSLRYLPKIWLCLKLVYFSFHNNMYSIMKNHNDRNLTSHLTRSSCIFILLFAIFFKEFISKLLRCSHACNTQ